MPRVGPFMAHLLSCPGSVILAVLLRVGLEQQENNLCSECWFLLRFFGLTCDSVWEKSFKCRNVLAE